MLSEKLQSITKLESCMTKQKKLQLTNLGRHSSSHGDFHASIVIFSYFLKEFLVTIQKLPCVK